jgi:hypothetical protein
VSELRGDFTARAEAWARRSPCGGRCNSLAFVAMPFALRLGTKIPSRLFLKDTYRFARSFHCPLSEDAVRRSDSSHGVHRVCPFTDISTARQLQLAETSLGEEMPLSSHVPSLSFLPTSTVYSARRPASLLHLAASRGVRPVLGPWHRSARVRPRGRYTLRSFSLSSSLAMSPARPRRDALCTMGRALPPLFLAPVPPACCHAGGFSARPSTSGLCSTEESVADERCCHLSPPDAPMGL